MLDREPGLSLRKLAGRLGMTPPRLCQVMNLLKLAPAVRKAILTLPQASGRDKVTEYSLRQVATRQSPTAQIRAFQRLSKPD